MHYRCAYDSESSPGRVAQVYSAEGESSKNVSQSDKHMSGVGVRLDNVAARDLIFPC